MYVIIQDQRSMLENPFVDCAAGLRLNGVDAIQTDELWMLLRATKQEYLFLKPKDMSFFCLKRLAFHVRRKLFYRNDWKVGWPPPLR